MDSEVLVLCTRRVAAAPTKVAATATETAVSGSADETANDLLVCNCDFASNQENKMRAANTAFPFHFTTSTVSSP